ncbi:MAG: CaiB/BaiF CoA-transferase family protein [Dehalococcoidales bacterium]|nr:CaiB/BaiF CoA-transferase family protein [Dehalococcoidales bacterium]MDP7109627.1 CaiB/BaiF CoA-transferase family protein [Dehalococcoidales bacterium]MDP7310038.1 CaiB/BaiF CoA-transferase family protein [Dehalococcoidales bacterium]MDP7409560.1 CaiB/BaiF CoA-transferase family protein [Dehalococcoidales bacterium]MDP7675894.1 CaiB/BaiF CoA-transferase family protein [Dehalococcoidales bacterium]
MRGPLHGIRVLDVSRILAGPFCTMLLADLGAEVVKVEIPAGGDPARSLEPTIGGDSVFFISVNRGKKSITLDLSTQDGQQIFRELVPHFDVLVENFVPGTMARFGVDYLSLKEINPRLVYASISGFGQDGPRAESPALDVTVMAMGGLMSITGQPGDEPLRPGASLADSVAGVFTALAIVSSLLQRQGSGLGQHIDMSMLDCQVTMMENPIARYFGTGQIPGPVGTRNPMAAPFQVFRASDGYFAVAMFSNDLNAWRYFCRVIGCPELGEDGRFKNNTVRTKHVDALTDALQHVFSVQPVTYWLKLLSEADIACAPVNNVKEVIEDSQVKHRGMIATIPHHFAGTWPVTNTPFKMSASLTGPAGGSAGLGEHTRTILHELLGLSDVEIDALKVTRVI